MVKLNRRIYLSKREKFAKLRDKGWTLKRIGECQKPPITSERVRQILSPASCRVCEKHRVKYYGLYCEYCIVEKNYPRVIRTLVKEGTRALEAEFERLSQPDRSKAVIIQRVLLVKALKDRMKYSIAEISRLLNRDYSSIKNLYYKRI